jgi:branched-chain amino acid transport system substrate-binding protein
MLRSKRTLILFIVVAVLAAMVVPTFASSTSVDRSEDNQFEGVPITIGLLTDQTSGLAFYGFEQVQGFELGLEYATNGTMEVAGRPIEVVIRDNAGDIEQAREDARELIETEQAEILVGTVSSTVTLNLQATAQENEIILMAGPAATPEITSGNFNEFTFRVCRNTFQDAAAASTFAADAYGDNYVIFAVDNAFGAGTAAAFDFVLQDSGATPVQDTIFVAGDSTDFTSPITEMINSGADYAVVIWAGAGGVELFQQMTDLGARDELGIVTGFNSNDIQAATSLNQPGDVGFIVYHYTAPDNEVNDWMVENHIERYDGDPPDLFTECGFATAQAVVAALEATNGDSFPEAMIPALEGLEFEGPKGTYFIRPEDHQALVPMYVLELTTLEPEEPFAFYELLAEISGEDAAPPCLAPGRSSETLECPPAE